MGENKSTGKFSDLGEPLEGKASSDQLSRVEKWQKAFKLPRDWESEGRIDNYAANAMKRKFLDPDARAAIAAGK